jgi:hypothetical protein
MRENDVDFQSDELGSELNKAFAPPLRPTIFDRDSASVDPAEFAQSLQGTCRRGVPRPFTETRTADRFEGGTAGECATRWKCYVTEAASQRAPLVFHNIFGKSGDTKVAANRAIAVGS